jgi:hypothetical protein
MFNAQMIVDDLMPKYKAKLSKITQGDSDDVKVSMQLDSATAATGFEFLILVNGKEIAHLIESVHAKVTIAAPGRLLYIS